MPCSRGGSAQVHSRAELAQGQEHLGVQEGAGRRTWARGSSAWEASSAPAPLPAGASSATPAGMVSLADCSGDSGMLVHVSSSSAMLLDVSAALALETAPEKDSRGEVWDDRGVTSFCGGQAGRQDRRHGGQGGILGGPLANSGP
jgi:hypothetical protein